MPIRLVEPLRLSLPHVLKLGQSNALNYARARFGSPDQLSAVADAVRANRTTKNEVVIDLTPFERIGRPHVVSQALRGVAEDMSCTFLCLDGETLETLEESGMMSIAGVAVYDDTGTLDLNASKSGTLSAQRDSAFRYLISKQTLTAVHADFAQRKLLELLRFAVENGHEAQPDVKVGLAGRDYIRLPSGMLASAYVNTKRLFSDPAYVIDIAYEVVRAAVGGFRRGIRHDNLGEIFLAPSNASLVLAAAAQSLTGVTCGIIDKLGPVPARRVASISSSVDVRDRKVWLVTDVCSTGSEIDRCLQYLHSRHASIVRVICCYHWQSGVPQLCGEGVFVPLCTPKSELGYVYRSS